MTRVKLALVFTAAWALTVLPGCDDGEPDTSDLEVVDAAPDEPDQAAAGCTRDIDCLASEYCARDMPMEGSDAEPPPGMCQPGCRDQPDTCPVGRMCNPETRECVTDCNCEPGEVTGCEGEQLRLCAANCLGNRAEPCPDGQICMGGACQPRPQPMPDMAPPPPEPDMAPPPPEPDMAPPPPEPDMAPPAPDMAPPEPDMAP